MPTRRSMFLHLQLRPATPGGKTARRIHRAHHLPHRRAAFKQARAVLNLLHGPAGGTLLLRADARARGWK